MLDSNHPVVQSMRNIKSISMLLDSNPHIADNYGISFLGEKQNIISAADFYSALHDYFKIDIDLEEFNRILPEICHLYSMKTELDKTGSYIQSITLW